MRVVAAAVVAVVAALAAGVDAAHACSCALPDARNMLPLADGAFVGKLVGRRDTGGGRSLFTFAVERSVKGGTGVTVQVDSASNGAACGIEATVGQRVGLLLERFGGQWHGSLCAQVDPDDLIAAAEPLPPPNGRGPVAMLVGGRFGTVRTIALDREGRTLAYGRGTGSTTAISVCPGRSRLAEAVAQVDGWQLAIRERSTLRRIRSGRLALPAATVVKALRCEDAAAASVLVFASSPNYPERARLLRIRGSGATIVWRGTATEATFSRSHAYVAAGSRGTNLLAVDLATGRASSRGRIPAALTALRLRRDGAYLAGIAFSGAFSDRKPSRAVLVDLRRRPVRVRTAPLGSSNVSGDVVWISSARLAVLESGDTNDVRVLDLALGLQSRFPGWGGRSAVVVGSSIYGIRWDGRVLRARLPSGPVKVVRRLPGPSVFVIVAAQR